MKPSIFLLLLCVLEQSAIGRDIRVDLTLNVKVQQTIAVWVDVGGDSSMGESVGVAPGNVVVAAKRLSEDSYEIRVDSNQDGNL